MSINTTKLFQIAGLLQVHHTLREEGAHPIPLHLNDLWNAYSLEDHLLTKVKLHLFKTNWLSGEWKLRGAGEGVDNGLDENGSEARRVEFFSRLFNVVLKFLRETGHAGSVEGMVRIEPGSTRVPGCHPGSFLQLATGTLPPPPMPGKSRWGDVVCPFEYTLGGGNVSDPESIARWVSPHPLQDDAEAFRRAIHVMRSDPRRAFSFGVTVHGSMFRTWLLCRAAPFTFTPSTGLRSVRVSSFGHQRIKRFPAS